MIDVSQKVDESQLRAAYDILKDKWQRLNSLYYIIDKKGKRVRFQCNAAQERLFETMWYMSIILKARQRGFTTFIDLYILDECLFNDNVEGAIIAHREEDAKKIFRRKIKYPYDHLPDQIREARPLITDSKSELAFNNNSVVYVAISVRSGTLQYLHLSEFGKVCAKFPEKAREVVTGSLETIQAGQMVWIESTAEGTEGYFYDYCKTAQDVEKSGRELSYLDFKFFFFPWWDDPENVLDTPYPISQSQGQYFNELRFKIGRKLTDQQKWWWCAKKAILKDDMERENPSTVEEAFAASIEGAYYAAQFAKIREDKRICNVPHIEGLRVDTWWDLGMDDSTCIWFTQSVGREIHLIDYYENCGEGLLHYAKTLDKKARDGGWVYGRHVAPHDITVRELGTGKSRLEQAVRLQDPVTGRMFSIRFEIAPRIESQQDGIEAVRNILSVCWFDETNTTIEFAGHNVGVASLEGYRKEWNEKLGKFHDRPLHNWASHGSKAFETMAVTLGSPRKFRGLEEAFG